MITPLKVFIFLLLSFVSVIMLSFVLEKSETSQVKYFTLDEMIGYESFKSGQLAAIEKQKQLELERIALEKLLAKVNGLQDSINYSIALANIDSTRFWFPEGQRNYWWTLFERWEKLEARKELFRIMHYGDSQIEMDRITGYIREQLQSMFGGGGPGLLPPVQLVPAYGIRQTSSENWTRLVSYGTSETRSEHNRYGPMGMLFRYDSIPEASVYISPRDKSLKNTSQFKTAKVLLGKSNHDIAVTLTYKNGSNTQIVIAPQREKMIRWNFTQSQPSFSFYFKAEPETDILGIAIDNPYGIAMDNIPWRGSSGLTFISNNKSTMSQTYRMLDVKMVIMQFGGNSMPYMKTEKDVNNYAQRFGKQIDYILSIDPSIRIMVIGPADMSTNQKGTMITYPMMEKVIEAMAKVTNEKGGVFWSMYHAMGGENSMPRWVNAKPQLGAADYIHFSKKGAEAMSELLFLAIKREYQIYQMFKRLEQEKLSSKEELKEIDE
jgi:lysophospholipase L1-like esterase